MDLLQQIRRSGHKKLFHQDWQRIVSCHRVQWHIQHHARVVLSDRDEPRRKDALGGIANHQFAAIDQNFVDDCVQLLPVEVTFAGQTSNIATGLIDI